MHLKKPSSCPHHLAKNSSSQSAEPVDAGFGVEVEADVIVCLADE